MDNFQPRTRFPLDPFANNPHTPWRVPLPVNIPPSCVYEQVVLVLGEPQAHEIATLFTSPRLAQSLLLIATHDPASFSFEGIYPHDDDGPSTNISTSASTPVSPTSTTGPTIRILHLPAPLNVHDTGALRFVSLLDRAQRIAEAWRAERKQHHPRVQVRIQQLAECAPGGEFCVVEPLSAGVKILGREMPGPASSIRTDEEEQRRNTKRKQKRFSLPVGLSFGFGVKSGGITENGNDTAHTRASTSVSEHEQERSTPAYPQYYYLNPTRSPTRTRTPLPALPLPPSRRRSHSAAPRAFDAILNFLPRNVGDKSLLKHAILVTTLSSQYLVRGEDGTEGNDDGGRGEADGEETTTTRRMSAFTKMRPLSLSMVLSSSFGEKIKPIEKEMKSSSRFSSIVFGSSSQADGEGEEVAWSSGTTMSRKKETKKVRPGQSPKKAHVVHVLPLSWVDTSSPANGNAKGKGKGPAGPSRLNTIPYLNSQNQNRKPKLVQSIEQFLLGFAGPYTYMHMTASSSSSSSAHSHSYSSSASSSASSSISGFTTTTASTSTTTTSTPTSTRPPSTDGYPGSISGSGSTEKTGTNGNTNWNANGNENRNGKKTIPFLMAPGEFGRIVCCACGCGRVDGCVDDDHVDGEHGDAEDETKVLPLPLTTGECVLLGLLDHVFDAFGGQHAMVRGERAWIARGDVVLRAKEQREKEDNHLQLHLPSPPESRRSLSTESASTNVSVGRTSVAEGKSEGEEVASSTPAPEAEPMSIPSTPALDVGVDAEVNTATSKSKFLRMLLGGTTKKWSFGASKMRAEVKV